MSLSDCGTTMQVAPVGYAGNNGANGNGLFGDDGALWLIVLFLFIFAGGWGGRGGWGGNGDSGSSSGVMDGYILTSDFASVERKLDDVNNGLCQGFYQVAQQFASVETAILTQGNATQVAMLQGFNGVERSVCALQAQIAQCCCEVQRQVESVRYDIAIQGGQTQNLIQSAACNIQNSMNGNTRDIIDSQRDGFNAILNKLTAQELAAKDAQIAAQNQRLFAAELAASQAAQNQYLVNQLRPCPQPAYITCNPWAGSSYGGCGSC